MFQPLVLAAQRSSGMACLPDTSLVETFRTCSEVLKHATRGDVRRAAKAAADAARQQSQPVVDAVSQATRDTAQSVSSFSDVLQGDRLNPLALLFCWLHTGSTALADELSSQPLSFVGGAQHGEALFRQTQSSVQHASRPAYQHDSNTSPEDTGLADVMPAPTPTKSTLPVNGRMLTFVTAGGKATLSSAAQTDFQEGSGKEDVLHPCTCCTAWAYA